MGAATWHVFRTDLDVKKQHVLLMIHPCQEQQEAVESDFVPKITAHMLV